ncbi:MAG TPA: TonB-dependent receptor [Bryobacteraceae bacterium]|nr:TonB-dependent receptor [Bryobacteraceae bacterium]
MKTERIFRPHRGLIGFFFVWLATAGVAFGQVAGGGSIQGTVTDPSGAVVPQVTVTATNSATGVQTVRQTTAAGLYVITPLPAGDYSLKVVAPGFQVLNQPHVVVDALATVSLDLQLHVGAATEEVTVQASATMLHTDDAVLGGNMQNNVYETLPLAMNGVPRDPTQFVALIPGVSGLSTQVAGPSTASFNGSPRGANEIYVEGLPLTFPSQQADTRNLALGVSVEAVDQFQAQTNGQKAMYQGSGFENYVLKSGTDQFHGGVFEYFRNTDLDARGFFPAVTPIEHQNEFGGTIGGPIKKDKIFFFASYDGYYYKTGQPPMFQSIPTLAERTGDFSAFPAVIYDPNTQVCNGAVCSKTPFANNMIPANRISSISKSFQSYLPDPTNGGIQSNYLASLPEGLHNNSTTDKVDWNLTSKNRMYFVYSRGKYSTDFTGSLAPGTDSLPLPYTQGRIVEEMPTTAQVHETYVITPNLLNDIAFGYARIWIPIISATAGGGYPTKAGLTGLPGGAASDVFPTVNFGGTNAPIGWAGTNAVAFDQAENAFTLQDNLQWVRGKHAITFGFQMQRGQDNNTNPDTGTRATFSFSNNETAGFSPTGTLLTTTGNSYASYLLGALDSASITQNYVVELGSRFHDYAAWIQDDFKVSQRLTLNLGLRYDLMGPYHEAYNRTSFLNPLMPNPAASGRLGALEFAGYGDGRCNCGNIPVKTHYLNFEPRVGLAYRLTEKTVFRGSFGMTSFRGGATGNNGTGASPGQLGFNASGSFSSATTGQPAFYWDGGVPPYQQPPFINPGYGTGFTTTSPTGASTLSYLNPAIGAKPPYSEYWNIGIQQTLTPNMTVGVAYAGNGGHFILGGGGTGIWSNSMPLQYLALGPLLGVQATPANVAAAKAVFPEIALPFANYQGTINQMLKPFPQYSGINYLWGNRGNSNYNSLQLTFDRRLSQGLTLHFGYVWSKEIDNATGSRNPFDGSLDKGLGSIDRTHVFTSTAYYALPFGKGHTMGNANTVVRALVSNWTVAGLVTFQSGTPLSISGSGCSTPGISSTCLVNYNPAFNGPVRINGDLGSGNVIGSGSTVYLDKTAFLDPAPYTFGNTPRSAPFGLRGPSTLDEDITLRREIFIRERVRFSIEANMFNITNSVVFNSPATNIDSATFGQVSSQTNLPRKVQFNARFSF